MQRFLGLGKNKVVKAEREANPFNLPSFSVFMERVRKDPAIVQRFIHGRTEFYEWRGNGLDCLQNLVIAGDGLDGVNEEGQTPLDLLKADGKPLMQLFLLEQNLKAGKTSKTSDYEAKRETFKQEAEQKKQEEITRWKEESKKNYRPQRPLHYHHLYQRQLYLINQKNHHRQRRQLSWLNPKKV